MRPGSHIYTIPMLLTALACDLPGDEINVPTRTQAELKSQPGASTRDATLRDLEAAYADQLTKCDFAYALSTLQKIAALRVELHGNGHWECIVDREAIKSLRAILSLAQNDRDKIARAREARMTSALAVRHGKYLSAERVIRESVQIHEQMLGTNDFGCIVARQAYVGVLMCLRRYPQAKEQCLEVIEGYKVLGPCHPAVAGALQTYGSILIEQGNHDQAEEPLRRSLQMCEQQFGVNAFECWPSHEGLARLYCARKDFERANDSIENALKITLSTSRSRGLEDYALCLLTKARICRLRGTPEEALRCCRRSLEIREMRQMNAVLIAQSLDELAGTLRALQRSDEACVYERRALDFRIDPNWEAPGR